MTTHAKLIERGAVWLRRGLRCSLVFAEMVTYASENPDLIGWKSYGRGTVLVEVKISRGDFLRDHKKRAHRLARTMGSQRYYLTPEHLVMPNEVPDDHGLAYVESNGRVRISKPAPERALDPAAASDETLMLLSAIRRMQLGTKFDPTTGRWESLQAALARDPGRTR